MEKIFAPGNKIIFFSTVIFCQQSMKALRLLILLLMTGLISCEKKEPQNFSNPIMRIGDYTEFNYDDFEMYDSSAKILYFKSGHPEFADHKDSEFSIFADTVFIYEGCFWSGYNSYFPSTPFITSEPLFYYQNHALGIEYLNQNKPDPRNDSRLMSAFKQKKLLHSGLSVSIESLSVSGTAITFSSVVTNHDESDLYVFDYSKMGTSLFHYYTNGLILVNKDQPEFIYCIIDAQGPVPIDTWKMEWLTLLKSGESIRLNIDYTIENQLKKGNYIAYFTFPGFDFQISKDDLNQAEGRIWLGKVTGSKKITIQ